MGDLSSYQQASAECLKIYMTDIIYNAARFEGLGILRDEIEFALNNTFSGLNATKTAYINNVKRALLHIYQYNDTVVDIPYLRELYHTFMVTDLHTRDKLKFTDKRTLQNELHRIFQIADPIGRSEVMFGYVLWRQIFPENNATAALLAANAISVCNGAGTFYASKEDLDILTPIVQEFDMEKDSRRLISILRGKCHHRILHAF